MSGNDTPSGQFWRADQPSHPLGFDRSQEISSDPNPTPEHASIPAGELIEQIQRAAQLLKNRLADHFQSFGLNEIRYTVINMVQESSPHGCSQTDLADALSQSESSISTLVERMRSDNLIYRLRSKIDRRKRVLILTEHGHKILHQIEDCHTQRLEQMMKNFRHRNNGASLSMHAGSVDWRKWKRNQRPAFLTEAGSRLEGHRICRKVVPTSRRSHPEDR